MRAAVVRAAGFLGAAGFFAVTGFLAAAGGAEAVVSSAAAPVVRLAAGRLAAVVAGFFGAAGAAASPSPVFAAAEADEVAADFFAAGLRAAAGRAVVERGVRGVDGREDTGFFDAAGTSSAGPSSGVGASEPDGVEVTSPTYQPPLTILRERCGHVIDCHESTTAMPGSAVFQVAWLP